MPEKMSLYGENGICVKCGSKDIVDYYMAKRDYISCVDWPKDPEQEEHIHRTCRRCQYSWNEAPLDSKVKP